MKTVLTSTCLLLTLLAPAGAKARHRKHHAALESAIGQAQSAVADALTKAPQDQEVCFAPVERCEAKLVKFIDTAQKSIDVAIFDINLDQVVHHLLVASAKIPVRFIVDLRQAKGPNSAVPLLLKAGAQVRLGKQRGIMHNKFMIVDGRMLETGSFNYTAGAAFKNNENQIYLANPVVVSRYVRRFEEIWGEALPAAGTGVAE